MWQIRGKITTFPLGKEQYINKTTTRTFERLFSGEISFHQSVVLELYSSVLDLQKFGKRDLK